MRAFLLLALSLALVGCGGSSSIDPAADPPADPPADLAGPVNLGDPPVNLADPVNLGDPPVNLADPNTKDVLINTPVTPDDPTPVPESSTVLLMGSGLVATVGWIRRRKRIV